MFPIITDSTTGLATSVDGPLEGRIFYRVEARFSGTPPVDNP